LAGTTRDFGVIPTIRELVITHGLSQSSSS
jgi:hypothetical protein